MIPESLFRYIGDEHSVNSAPVRETPGTESSHCLLARFVNPEGRWTETIVAPVCCANSPVPAIRLQQTESWLHSPPPKAQRMAEFFSVLADANRLRLLSILAEQELCVCDLAALVEMSESAVSHQLRLLRSMRLVRFRKQGRKVFYTLDDRHVLDLYRTAAEHLDEST